MIFFDNDALRRIMSGGRVRHTHARARTRVRVGAMIACFALVLGACSGSGEAQVSSDLAESSDAEFSDAADSSGLTGQSSSARSDGTLTVGQQTSFTFAEGENRMALTFEASAGSSMILSAATPSSNATETFVSFGPPQSQMGSMRLAPGQDVDPVTLVTAHDSSLAWTLELQGSPGDTVNFQIDALAQTDLGGTGDAGNTPDTMFDLDTGSAAVGLLGGEDAADWFALPLVGGEVVSIAVDLTEYVGNGGIQVELVHNGQAKSSVSVFPGGQETMQHIFAQDQAGQAQLHVSGDGAYGLQVLVEGQNDGGSAGDAGADTGALTPVEFGEISGLLGDDDTSDFYSLVLPKDAVLEIEGAAAVVDGSGAGGSVGLTLHYNGNRAGELDLAAGQSEQLTSVLLNGEGEQLVLEVKGAGSYTYKVSAQTQTDGGGDVVGDAPGEEALAKEISTSGSFVGWLNPHSKPKDGRDSYTFTATETGTISLTLAIDPVLGPGSTKLRLDPVGGNEIGDAHMSLGGGATSTYELAVEAGQQFLIRIQNGSGIASYTLTLA